MNLWQIYCPEIPDFLQKAFQTSAMQRLRHVGMNCGCEYTSFPLFRNISPYSRLDHSMGVALIVWHFTGKAAESLAGCFHDIATPAFAHVIDFLNGDHMTQESTELGTKEAIGKDPEIASLLSDLALTPEQVDDYHLYPIADNDSPQLSADRLEYTLGNSLNYRILSHSQIENLYRDLCVGVNEYQQPEIMFRSKDCALQFAEAALQCSKIYISDPDRYAMQILAELLGTAIGNGILSPSDLNGTEAAVIQKLTASSLEAHWKQFRSLHKIRTANAPGSTGTWRKIAAKKRMIDPCIVHVGRCSSVFPDLHKALEDFKCSSQDVWLCGN